MEVQILLGEMTVDKAVESVYNFLYITVGNRQGLSEYGG